MVNHFALFLPGFATAKKIQWNLRLIYQNLYIEILLMLSLVIHMGTNIALYRKRQRLASSKEDGKVVKGSSELKAHRMAGYFLALTIAGHVGAVRVVPLFYLDDPSEFDYSFVAATMERIPGHVFSIYLAFLGMAGGWHLLFG